MRTSKTAHNQKESTDLTNNTPTALLPKARYPFPYHAGIFEIAAKRYKPSEPEKSVENTSDYPIDNVNEVLAKKIQYVLGI